MKLKRNPGAVLIGRWTFYQDPEKPKSGPPRTDGPYRRNPRGRSKVRPLQRLRNPKMPA